MEQNEDLCDALLLVALSYDPCFQMEYGSELHWLYNQILRYLSPANDIGLTVYKDVQ